MQSQDMELQKTEDITQKNNIPVFLKIFLYPTYFIFSIILFIATYSLIFYKNINIFKDFSKNEYICGWEDCYFFRGDAFFIDNLFIISISVFLIIIILKIAFYKFIKGNKKASLILYYTFLIFFLIFSGFIIFISLDICTNGNTNFYSYLIIFLNLLFFILFIYKLFTKKIKFSRIFFYLFLLLSFSIFFYLFSYWEFGIKNNNIDADIKKNNIYITFLFLTICLISGEILLNLKKYLINFQDNQNTKLKLFQKIFLVSPYIVIFLVITFVSFKYSLYIPEVPKVNETEFKTNIIGELKNEDNLLYQLNLLYQSNGTGSLKTFLKENSEIGQGLSDIYSNIVSNTKIRDNFLLKKYYYDRNRFNSLLKSYLIKGELDKYIYDEFFIGMNWDYIKQKNKKTLFFDEINKDIDKYIEISKYYEKDCYKREKYCDFNKINDYLKSIGLNKNMNKLKILENITKYLGYNYSYNKEIINNDLLKNLDFSVSKQNFLIQSYVDKIYYEKYLNLISYKNKANYLNNLDEKTKKNFLENQKNTNDKIKELDKNILEIQKDYNGILKIDFKVIEDAYKLDLNKKIVLTKGEEKYIEYINDFLKNENLKFKRENENMNYNFIGFCRPIINSSLLYVENGETQKTLDILLNIYKASNRFLEGDINLFDFAIFIKSKINILEAIENIYYNYSLTQEQKNLITKTLKDYKINNKEIYKKTLYSENNYWDVKKFPDIYLPLLYDYKELEKINYFVKYLNENLDNIEIKDKLTKEFLDKNGFGVEEFGNGESKIRNKNYFSRKLSSYVIDNFINAMNNFIKQEENLLKLLKN